MHDECACPHLEKEPEAGVGKPLSGLQQVAGLMIASLFNKQLHAACKSTASESYLEHERQCPKGHPSPEKLVQVI